MQSSNDCGVCQKRLILGFVGLNVVSDSENDPDEDASKERVALGKCSYVVNGEGSPEYTDSKLLLVKTKWNIWISNS